MKKMIATGMAGLMMAASMTGTAQAGHREWETAGKILTGVMIGTVVRDVCVPRLTATVTHCGRPSYRQPPAEWNDQAPPRHHEPPRCEPRPMPRCPPPRIEREPACRGPIVLNMEDGRRLFQPPEHGHVAYVQVWSSMNRQWVSIAEYPSIW
jgi:hypothetical protein